VSVYGLAKSRMKGNGLPCCTFVALALLEAEGHQIDTIEDGPKASGLAWWRQANVWDGSEPWSALRAAEVMSRSASLRIMFVGELAPPLKPGRWHVVQRWKGLDLGDDPGPGDDRVIAGRSTGHTYLAHMDQSGRARIVQSSVAHGYRDTVGTWSGDAGLAGYSVGVCYLPEGWSWAGS